MRRIVLSLLAVAVAVLYLSPVAYAGEGNQGNAIGRKVVLGNNGEAVVTDVAPDGTYTYRATFGGPKYLDDLTTVIRPHWLSGTGTNTDWVTDVNLFSASVKGIRVWVEKDGAKLTWTPGVRVDGKWYKVLDSVPSLLSVDPENENYTTNTLMWDYGIAKRYLRIIEGAIFERYVFDSNPGGDVAIRSNLYRNGEYIWDTAPFAYDANGLMLDISLERGNKTVAASEFNREDIEYPVTIDPTSTFTTSASDGRVQAAGAAWAAAHDAATGTVTTGAVAVKIGVSALSMCDTTVIDRVGVFFDTSGLPDGATVTAAELKLYMSSIGGGSRGDVEIQSGAPTYPSDPMAVGDYLHTNYAGDGGTLAKTAFNVGAYSSITLTAAGRGWVETAGDTKFILRDTDDVDDVPFCNPFSYFWMFAFEKGDGFWPQLEVTYTSSSTPTITTDAASDVQYTTARLHSTLSDDGGMETEVRFQFYETGDPAWGEDTAWVDGYLTGNQPWVDLDTLTVNKLHHFRVQAKNDDGTVNGASEDFTTLNAVNEPSAVNVYPGEGRIVLTWVKGTGASTTIVRAKQGSYPVDETDGIDVFSGTMNSTSLNSLGDGETYYFSLWGESGGTVSGASFDILATTTSSVAAGATRDTPAQPVSWFQATNYTKLSDLPFYAQINDLADSLSVPRTTAWMLVGLAIIVVAGVATFAASRDAVLSLTVMAIVSLVVVFLLELLPLWMVIFSILFAIGAAGITKARQFGGGL